MKYEDIKVGMKVVPFQKTATGWNDLNDSYNWNRANKNKQKFLYVNTIIKEDKIALGVNSGSSGDYFNAKDFVLYKENIKAETFQAVDTSYIKYKIIINGTTTIVILEDGSKGIAKCLPDDVTIEIKV